jgi:hypothetical protein
MRRRSFLTTAILALTASLGPAGGVAAESESCDPVRNPYPGTRYAGVALSRIEATGISCADARRVARRAHRKALAMTPEPNGTLAFGWHGWRVRGDLRPPSDVFSARRGALRVSWKF